MATKFCSELCPAIFHWLGPSQHIAKLYKTILGITNWNGQTKSNEHNSWKNQHKSTNHNKSQHKSIPTLACFDRRTCRRTNSPCSEAWKPMWRSCGNVVTSLSVELPTVLQGTAQGRVAHVASCCTRGQPWLMIEIMLDSVWQLSNNHIVGNIVVDSVSHSKV